MYGMTVRVQAKGQVTLPKKIREKLNIEPGDLVQFRETEEGVMVEPATLFSGSTPKDQLKSAIASIREEFAEYSTEEIQAIVDEAITETRKGNK